jgi:hypothetical protein
MISKHKPDQVQEKSHYTVRRAFIEPQKMTNTRGGTNLPRGGREFDHPSKLYRETGLNRLGMKMYSRAR